MQPEQASLFAADTRSLPLEGGELQLWPALLETDIADDYLKQLHAGIDWQQQAIRMYGKTVPVPRLTAWHGDRGSSYTWSGIRNQPRAWTPLLTKIKTVVEATTGRQFNSVLLNLYRNGDDSVAWHCDDEPELGEHPAIASLSLGAQRRFQLKHKANGSLQRALLLPHGSLLLMSGATQRNWSHRVPKCAGVTAPRINLTFRRVY